MGATLLLLAAETFSSSPALLAGAVGFGRSGAASGMWDELVLYVHLWGSTTAAAGWQDWSRRHPGAIEVLLGTHLRALHLPGLVSCREVPLPSPLQFPGWNFKCMIHFFPSQKRGCAFFFWVQKLTVFVLRGFFFFLFWSYTPWSSGFLLAQGSAVHAPEYIFMFPLSFL